MTNAVVLTDDALNDLDDIHAYIATHDSLQSADRVVDRIGEVLSSLSGLPQRGAYPPELSVLGIHDYRQVHCKPYRMIYQLRADTAYVLLIADGRRDIQTLLQRRLFD